MALLGSHICSDEFAQFSRTLWHGWIETLYGDIEGLEECKACAHGTYTDQSSQSLCESCNQGLVARAPDANDFHTFMPYACSSAEMLGEYRSGTSPYAKTMEDTGLLLQQTHDHLEACLEACALVRIMLNYIKYLNTSFL